MPEVDLKAVFNRLVDKPPMMVFSVVITEVDTEQNTCIGRDIDGVEHREINLNSFREGNFTPGITVYPKKNAEAYVGCINNDIDNLFLIQTSDIDTIKIHTGKIELSSGDVELEGSNLKINIENNTIINDGENGGLIKYEELKKELNTQKELVQSLLEIFTSVRAVTPMDGGLGLWNSIMIAATQVNAKIKPNFNRSNILNDKVTH